VLAVAAVAAAFVSDWFVTALEPAMDAAGISEAFAGLVIVAIAGNAIENVVGIQLAAKGESEYAFSVVLNSPIQIALVLAPLW
jgi:Ca2+:H+ antiporter